MFGFPPAASRYIGNGHDGVDRPADSVQIGPWSFSRWGGQLLVSGLEVGTTGSPTSKMRD
jgi:hypothetical protein